MNMLNDIQITKHRQSSAHQNFPWYMFVCNFTRYLQSSLQDYLGCSKLNTAKPKNSPAQSVQIYKNQAELKQFQLYALSITPLVLLFMQRRKVPNNR